MAGWLMSTPSSEMRTKSGLMRVQKGHSFMLPLMSQPPEELLLQMLSGDGRQLSWPHQFDAKHLKMLGFVIANDTEILSNEFLRIQPWGSKFGLKAHSVTKSFFLKPIRRIVKQQLLIKKKKRSTPSRALSTLSVGAKAVKVFREETVRIHRQDLLDRLSIHAVSHLTRRLKRFGTNSDLEMQDSAMLKQVKEKCLIFKQTPIFLARNNPFAKKKELIVEVKEDALVTPDLSDSSPISLSGLDMDSLMSDYLTNASDELAEETSEPDTDLQYDSSSKLISLAINQ